MLSRKQGEHLSVNKLQVTARLIPSFFARLPIPLSAEISSIYSKKYLDETRGIWIICSHDSMLDPYYWLAALTRAGVLEDRIVAAPIAMHQMEDMHLVVRSLEVAVGGVALPIYTQNSRRGEIDEVYKLRAKYVEAVRQTLSNSVLGVVPVAAMAKREQVRVTNSGEQGPMRLLAKNNIGDSNIVFLATHVGERRLVTAHRRIVVSGPVLFSDLITASRGITRVDNLARCILAANGGDNTIDPRTIGEAKEMINNKFGSDRSRTILTSV